MIAIKDLSDKLKTCLTIFVFNRRIYYIYPYVILDMFRLKHTMFSICIFSYL